MSQRRSILDFPRNEAGLVDNFIGTAYDTVKNVSDNMGELGRLDDVLAEIPVLAAETAQKAVEDAMPPVREELQQATDMVNSLVEEAQVTVDNGESQLNSIVNTADTQFEIKLSAAEAAAARAEAASDAAQVIASIYPTIALGLAATVSDKYFSVPPADNNEYLILYQNVAGVAVEKKRYPSAAAVSSLEQRANTHDQMSSLSPLISVLGVGDCLSVVVNEAGSVLEAMTVSGVKYVNSDGRLVRVDTLNVTMNAPSVEVPGIGLASSIYVDEKGAVIGGVSEGINFYVQNGKLVLASNVPDAQAPGYSYSSTPAYAFRTADPAICDIWVAMGQSLAAGENPNQADATVSGVPQHEGYAFTFGNGAYVGRPPFNYPIDTLGGLKEKAFSYSAAGNCWESICSRFGWTLLDKMQADMGGKQKIFAFSTGVGGREFAYLTRGGPVYTNLLAQLTVARDLLKAQGLKPRLRGLLVVHGEQDTSIGTTRSKYKKMLQTWLRWVEDDARLIFGDNQRSATVEMFTSQVCQGLGQIYFQDMPVASAQLDANDQNPNTTCVGPIYWVPSAAGNVTHPSAAGYARMGEMFADAVYKQAYSNLAFIPVHVINSRFTNDTHIRLRYSEPVAVEADDTLITISTLGAGKGFDFQDGTSTPPTVTSVAVVSSVEIEITLSSASIGNTPRLYYATRQTPGAISMSTTSYRGGVRAASAYMSSAINGAAAYHWACHQTIQVGDIK